MSVLTIDAVCGVSGNTVNMLKLHFDIFIFPFLTSPTFAALFLHTVQNLFTQKCPFQSKNK